MLLNSRALALLLSVSISVITTAFLYLVPQVTVTALFVAFGLSFSSSYLLISLVLEFLFFKEINGINEAFENIRKKDFTEVDDPSSNPLSPLNRINEEIYSYAKIKQREIDELKKMEAFRREFLADVSHELKTPIFAAQGFVHTLLDGAVEDKSVRIKFLKKAAKSLDGLDILVHDLLTISQMETGEIKMHFEDFDVRELT
ncbi:MAG: histidine kinase dimerization/phospho-acceptor domain-containing protein, partial [Imperialibacter sp.]